MSKKQKVILMILLILIVLISAAMIIGLILGKTWVYYLIVLFAAVGATLSIVNIIRRKNKM